MKNGKYEYDIFISYSRKNRHWTNKLVKILKFHDIKVWIDSLEITVGDRFRAKIEEGILKSRYFCLIISNHSMKSYYVRKIELESAFSLMISTQRDSYILPLVIEHPNEDLPLMLQQFHYLDFSNRRIFANNLSQLISKIKLGDFKFTGERYFKNFDVSPFGIFVGIDAIEHKSYSGFCTKIKYIQGEAVKLDMYVDGKIHFHKEIEYRDNRVSQILKFHDEIRVEKLLYFYNKEGIRVTKISFGTSANPQMRIVYDTDGRRIKEEFFDVDGNIERYKEYYYTGNEKVEVWKNALGEILQPTD